MNRIKSEAFAYSGLESITFPRGVKILCPGCFVFCKSLSSISFENGSRLMRIESDAFIGSGLKSITIPRDFDFIDGTAFFYLSQISISIEAGNSRSIVDSSFILDSPRSKLIQYFGRGHDVMSPVTIEIFC
jgi:hypothetical protein